MSADLTDDLYGMYTAAFGPLRTLAAARQLLHPEEFTVEMADDRVSKYVAWNDKSQPVGMATMTRELQSLDWISPDFYQFRYPEHAADNTLFYLGFILVRPDLQISRVFHRLCQVVTQIVADEQGVLCYDICDHNNEEMKFADRIESFVKRQLGGRFGSVDTQTYYSIDFNKESDDGNRH